jgi:lipid II:glycine glycyltransferase (peptidoglycan interpeptide bridge formation enzyme)
MLGIYHLALAMRGPIWLKDIDDAVKQETYLLVTKTLPIHWPRVRLFMPIDTPPAHKKRIMTGYSTIMIDISQPEETLLGNLDSKWRNRLRAAQKEHVEIKTSHDISAYEWLLDEESKQQSRAKYLALPSLWAREYSAQSGSKHILIITAYKEEKPIAAVLCLLHHHTATYHIGWNSEKGKSLNMHNLLLWKAIEALKQRNIRWFDLGGINTEESEGVARFKLGIGGTLVQYPGTYL